MVLKASLITAILVLQCYPALAIVEWHVECGSTQEEFEATVSVFNQYVQEGNVEGYELLFEQSAIGICGEPEIFHTAPLHAPITTAEFTFVRPVPEANRYSRFRVLIRHPDGSVHDTSVFVAPSWTAESCGEAVAIRGYIVHDDGYDFIGLEPCPDACDTWPCLGGIYMRDIPEEEWKPLVGVPILVDIYGDYTPASLIGGPCLYAESWRPTPSGECGPVSERSESWGGVRALYR